MYLKNVAGQALGFEALNAITGSPQSGVTASVVRSIDGGGQAAATGTLADLGNGQFVLTMSAADCNGTAISFLFRASGCIPVEKTVLPFDPATSPFSLEMVQGMTVITPVSEIVIDQTNGLHLTGATPTATLSLNAASVSQAGAMTTGAQVFAGDKTFTGTVTASLGLVVSGTATVNGLVVAGAGFLVRESGTGHLYVGNAFAGLSVDTVAGLTVNLESFTTATPSYAVQGNVGAWGTASGLTFAGGLYISGTVSAAGVSGLATVATTGAYADLTGAPALATVATTGAYADLTGAPALATVATTGAYADLTGTPDLSAISPHELLTQTSAGIYGGVAPGTAGNVLTSNGTDWTSSPAPGGLSIGAAVSGGTAQQVLFVDGSGNLGQSANLTFYPPSNTLTVAGTVAASQGVFNATLCNGLDAGSFYDGTRRVTLCDGTNAITYAAAVPGNWAGGSPPTDAWVALDRIAAALSGLGSPP